MPTTGGRRLRRRRPPDAAVAAPAPQDGDPSAACMSARTSREPPQALAGAPARVRRRAACVATLICCVVVFGGALAAAANPAAADGAPLPSAFAIDHGAPLTNSVSVTVGDGGASPFFRPAVLAWDGGSIVGGIGAEPGLGLPDRCARLLSRPSTSYVSWTAFATLTDMLREAPLEVDARYEAAADANVCIVMGGGGDLRAGRPPSEAYADLARYCAARRAAGFRVIVLTLLPRSRPVSFEAARQEFNALVRAGFTSFADGLADVGADARIGDPGDNLDPAYYRADELHPNSTGHAVMAAVTARALRDLAWRSDTCRLRLRNADGSWTGWRPYSARSLWTLAAPDGRKTVLAQYRDGAGATVTLQDTIRLDSRRPSTRAPFAARAAVDGTVRLRYRVVDPLPSCGRADVVVRIATPGGRLVRILRYTNRPVNRPLEATFVCRLAAGRYRFSICAVDAAGNRQARVGANTLTVR